MHVRRLPNKKKKKKIQSNKLRQHQKALEPNQAHTQKKKTAAKEEEKILERVSLKKHKP